MGAAEGAALGAADGKRLGASEAWITLGACPRNENVSCGRTIHSQSPSSVPAETVQLSLGTRTSGFRSSVASLVAATVPQASYPRPGSTAASPITSIRVPLATSVPKYRPMKSLPVNAGTRPGVVKVSFARAISAGSVAVTSRTTHTAELGRLTAGKTSSLVSAPPSRLISQT